MDGGATVAGQAADGALTVTQMVPPTEIAPGWYTGGEVDGTFSVNMIVDGGAMVAQTGQFHAPGCDYEPPLFLF